MEQYYGRYCHRKWFGEAIVAKRGRKKGYKRSLETREKIRQGHLKRKATLGSVPFRRKEEPDYQESSGFGDGDYRTPGRERSRAPFLHEERSKYNG